jgi:hypothetical protein
MTLSFKQFMELHRHHKHKKKPDYIDALDQELGIDKNSLPDVFDSGPIELEDDGILFNQAIWQIIKPIEDTDNFVRIKFYKSKSPNFERAYVRKQDGTLQPYHGDIEGRVFFIPIKKLSEILGKGFQGALQGAGGPGGMV